MTGQSENLTTPEAGAPTTNPEDDISAPDDLVLRYVRPVLAALLTCGSLAYSADLYRDAGLVLFPEQFLAGMLGVALALVFLHYPARRYPAQPLRFYSLFVGIAVICLGLKRFLVITIICVCFWGGS